MLRFELRVYFYESTIRVLNGSRFLVHAQVYVAHESQQLVLIAEASPTITTLTAVSVSDGYTNKLVSDEN